MNNIYQMPKHGYHILTSEPQLFNLLYPFF
jgi:hypothetical protein